MSSNITTDQLGELILQAKKGRITRDMLQKFLYEPTRVMAGWENFVLDAIVDHNKSIEKLAEECAGFNIHDQFTTDNYPSTTNGQVRTFFKLVLFEKVTTTEDAFKYFADNGLVVANMKELLTFVREFYKRFQINRRLTTLAERRYDERFNTYYYPAVQGCQLGFNPADCLKISNHEWCWKNSFFLTVCHTQRLPE